jgi:hypothetical protein
MTGYIARPGEISTEYHKMNISDGEKHPETDDLTDTLNKIDNHNKEGIENSELMTTSLSLGEAWELWWVSDDLSIPNGVMTPEYKIVPNTEAYPIFTEDLKPKLEAFLRYSVRKDKSVVCDVYMPSKSNQWVKTDRDKEWRRNKDGDTKYPYQRVPAIQFRTSMSDVPIFEAQKPIMDALDVLVSKTQNEVDRFNALITLFPGDVSKKFIEELTTMAKPFIQNLDEYDPAQWPKYLEKKLIRGK